jgi:hypothetical protein
MEEFESNINKSSYFKGTGHEMDFIFVDAWIDPVFNFQKLGLWLIRAQLRRTIAVGVHLVKISLDSLRKLQNLRRHYLIIDQSYA